MAQKEITLGFYLLYCRSCNKKTPHIARGFLGHNRRYECTNCGCIQEDYKNE